VGGRSPIRRPADWGIRKVSPNSRTIHEVIELYGNLGVCTTDTSSPSGSEYPKSAP